MKTNETAPSLGERAQARSQTGIALIVALILLVIVTLVGLAAMRGTIMQQIMTANFYDRQIAFQAAEAALRAGAYAITTPGTQIYNCGQGGSLCQANPFNDPNLPSGYIYSVSSGTGAGSFTASSVAPMQPQYVVENMGSWATTGGSAQTGSQYGYQNANKGSSTTSIFYRVTARSGDPAQVGDRAVVTLQAVYKQ